MNKTPHLRFPDIIAYVPIPKDLTRVKSKLMFNLDKRQLICFGTAAVIGVPTYLFTRAIIGNSAAVFLMIGIMMPFFLLAMFERDGQPAEKILIHIIRAKFWPAVRVYKTENIYKYLSDSIEGRNDLATKGARASKAHSCKPKRGKGEKVRTKGDIW